MRIDIEGVIIDAKKDGDFLTIIVQQNGTTVSIVAVDLTKNIKDALEKKTTTTY